MKYARTLIIINCIILLLPYLGLTRGLKNFLISFLALCGALIGFIIYQKELMQSSKQSRHEHGKSFSEHNPHTEEKKPIVRKKITRAVQKPVTEAKLITEPVEIQEIPETIEKEIDSYPESVNIPESPLDASSQNDYDQQQ